MTIQQVIDAILAYHPALPEGQPTCDGFKCGNPADECRGIVTSCAASMAVIRRAVELGANLILVHEPTFYTHMDPVDWLEGDPVYEEKRALLDAHGIAVWRDHDHIHTHKPDGIFTGVLVELGWADYLVGDNPFLGRVRLPEAITLQELMTYLKEKMHLSGLRYVGNADARVQNIAFGSHMFMGKETDTTQLLMDPEVDVMIPGEVIDWTAMGYARDAAQQGRNKAILNLGHISWEELGMKWMGTWLRPLIDPDLPITFVPSADLYNFLEA